MEHWWSDTDRGKPQRKICPSVTLFTTNTTWTDQSLNAGLCSEKPAHNRLGHGMTSGRI
jgi:hypothetical protein